MTLRTGFAAALALAAAGAASALTPQEAQRLVADNNRKADGLVRTLEGFRQGVPRVTHLQKQAGGKDWAKIAATAKELDALLALKEGRPTCVSEGKVRYLVAQALSRPVNFLRAAEAEKEYLAAIRLAGTNADERALFSYGYAKFKYDAAENDQPQKWRDEQVAAYSAPGVSARMKLQLLAEGVPGLDYDAEGRKVVGEDPELWDVYTNHRLRQRSWQYAHTMSRLDPVSTPEYGLKACEEGLAHIPEKFRGGYTVWSLRAARRSFLCALGRHAEVERELFLEVADAKDDPARARAYIALAELYKGMAPRYYQPDEPVLAGKCVQAYENAISLDPKNGGYCRSLVDYLGRTKNWTKLGEWIGRMQANGMKIDGKLAGWYGDSWYYAGDYGKAVEWYAACGERMDVCEREPPNRWDRYVGALYALGRYEEALKVSAKLADWFVWKDYKVALRERLQRKIAETTKVR